LVSFPSESEPGRARSSDDDEAFGQPDRARAETGRGGVIKSAAGAVLAEPWT